MKCLVKDTNTV